MYMTDERTYKLMFSECPDVLDVESLSRLLEISKKTAYKLLNENQIHHMRVGCSYCIPKICIIDYIMGKDIHDSY
jgi:excisionase family DNA binding protein